GIPDDLDQFPADPHNFTFYWSGGTVMVEGRDVVYPPAYYAGPCDPVDWNIYFDSDGDNLPDGVDPFPSDPSNHSEWWPGGNFVIEHTLQNLPAQWHQMDAPD